MKNFLIQESAMSVMPQISKRNENTVEFIAVLQEANRPNRNGRIYRKEVLEQALAAPYVQERIRTNSFFGEAGHPNDTSVQRQMTIDQRNIACLIKEFWWEGDLLKARVETANTQIGRDMKGLIEQGSRVAFSLRAQGNVHHDPMLNATVVDAPIQIATYDWVVNPSHDKAFLESICEATSYGLFGSKQTTALMLSESVNLFENGNLISLSEVVQPVVVDYAKNYGLKFKSLSEAYIYEKGDKLVTSGKVATVVNENVTKKVVLEDFLLKDLRHKIARLTEEEVKLGDAAAEPVHRSEEVKEHTPEFENKDVYPADEHQQAEEVEEVIVEAEKPELTDEEKNTPMVKATKEQLEKLLKVTGSTQKPIINPGVVGSSKIVKEEEAHVSGQDVSKEEAEAVKSVEVLDNTGAIAKVEASDHTEVVDGVVKIKDHDHASEEGAKVRDALHESDHKDEDEPKNADEIAKGTDLVHAEVVDGEIKVEDHDHADAEGQEVRDSSVIQEKKELPEALKKNTYDDPTDGNKIPEKLEKHVYARKGEKYTKEELKEAFEALELDTDKYTFEYLAEELGFEPLNELDAQTVYNAMMKRKNRYYNAEEDMNNTPEYQEYKKLLYRDPNDEPGKIKNLLSFGTLRKKYEKNLPQADKARDEKRSDAWKRALDSEAGQEYLKQEKKFQNNFATSGKYVPKFEKAQASDLLNYRHVDPKAIGKEPMKGERYFDGKIYNDGIRIKESYTREELMEAFEALDLDTDKYTFEYLAEQLGFETVFPSDEHMQETDLDSKELGGEPSNARVAAQKPAKAGETVESSEEIKSEKLGGEPTDARVKGSKVAKAGETLHHAEEVKAVIVESAKVKLGNIKVKGGK
jgi:hypothetical protein